MYAEAEYVLAFFSVVAISQIRPPEIKDSNIVIICMHSKQFFLLSVPVQLLRGRNPIHDWMYKERRYPVSSRNTLSRLLSSF